MECGLLCEICLAKQVFTDGTEYQMDGRPSKSWLVLVALYSASDQTMQKQKKSEKMSYQTHGAQIRCTYD